MPPPPQGTPTTDGSTTYLNASTCDLQYRADNPPLVFDLPRPAEPERRRERSPEEEAPAEPAPAAAPPGEGARSDDDAAAPAAVEGAAEGGTAVETRGTVWGLV